MKNLKILMLILLVVMSMACSKDDDINDFSSFLESYNIKLSGGTSNGSFNETIIVEPEDVINDEKVKINSVYANGNTLSIRINIPADLSPSGKKERIGMSIENLDANDIWNLEDSYQTFHKSISGDQRKRAVIDYIIEDDSEQFGTLNLYTKSTISLKREGVLLKGTIQAVVQSSKKNQVTITGNFEANLDEEDLD